MRCVLYGAELIEVTKEQGMEGARDLAAQMQNDGVGLVLNQFGKPGQCRSTLPDHGSRNLAANRWQNYPFCQFYGYHRHHHGCVENT